MPNSQKNDIGNLVTICPYCNARIHLQFQIVDFFIYTSSKNNIQSIILKKIISKKPETEQYFRNLIVNSLKKKPFISRILITKPYHEVINELRKTGFFNE